tara:strand:+ start:179 stop:361 length:183 start_codon:yes stop_codon:yes gene_type:complete
MKEIEFGSFHGDDLKEMGDGSLEKDIEEINKEGWEIVHEYFDQETGGTYYTVAREKINLF